MRRMTGYFRKTSDGRRRRPPSFGNRLRSAPLPGSPGAEQRLPIAPGGSVPLHLSAQGGDIAPVSPDPAAGRRWIVAAAAALLVHAAGFSIALLKLPMAHRELEDKAIPVEIVRETPPKPPVEAKAEPEPQPVAPPEPNPAPQAQPPRESGGDSDLAPGRVAEASPPPPPPHRSFPLPRPRPAPPAAKQSAAEPDLALSDEPSAMSIPFDPPPVPPQIAARPVPVPAPVPAPRTDPKLAKALDMSLEKGQGGGDRYLNSVRDDILSHFTYPAEAKLRQLTGTAQYEIVVDRQGNLLGLRLVSSAGNEILDQAGLESIRRSAPFRPVPDDVTGDRIGLLFTLYMDPQTAPLN